MALEALFDAVIVKPIEVEETTYGNIIVPDIGKETNETGRCCGICGAAIPVKTNFCQKCRTISL